MIKVLGRLLGLHFCFCNVHPYSYHFSYHQILCPSKCPEASALYDLIDNKGHGQNEEGEWKDFWAGHYSPIVLAKIWGMIIAEAKRLMKQAGCQQPTIEHWARAKMPFRK